MPTLSFKANDLWIDGIRTSLPYPIVDVFVAGRIIIVQFDPDVRLKEFFNNVVGLDFSGRHLWTAELPPKTGTSADNYLAKAQSRSPVQFVSFSSFICTLDPRTGKIIRTEFTK